MDVEELNEHLRDAYAKTPSMENLERYVMSELLDPIEDFRNAVRIIEQNYSEAVSDSLLMVGAHCASYWPPSAQNALLLALNRRYLSLSERDKAIVCYLNAYQIQATYPDYRKNEMYRRFLLDSMKYSGPFVNNRIALAEIVSKEEAKALYGEAVKNVTHVSDMEELKALPDEFWLDPQYYIDEFILGTSIAEDFYEELCKKAERSHTQE